MSLCNSCEYPLVLDVDHDQGDDASPGTVPDDLQLGCGCHFHWACLMDEASLVTLSLRCPSCEAYLAVNQAGPSSTNPFLQSVSVTPILARYINEGGVQDNLDILPSITEEAYLQNHPEAQPARALHVMCSQGDAEGIVELLRVKVNDEVDMASLMYYQDPLADMKSGLHLAVENRQEEVVWLLLWLSSTIPAESFPMPVRNAAESVGLGRVESQGGDIRDLQDSQGRTAEHIAQAVSWTAILQAGVLSP